MNFLNFLTSGAGIFNFNLQSLSMNNNTNSLNKNLVIPIVSPNDTAESSINKKNPSLPDAPSSDQLMERILTNPQTEMLTHQQQLINQYIHLNIQLLSKKIQNLENHPQKKEEPEQIETKSSKKKIKKQNVNCGHNDRQHYAKGMCNNCYHKNGRTKKPWKCQHEKLYANGLCQNCYINKYNKMKRERSHNSDCNQQASQSKQLNSEPKIEESQ